MNTNLFGLLYCAREAAKIMKEGDYEALIINVGRYLIQQLEIITHNH